MDVYGWVARYLEVAVAASVLWCVGAAFVNRKKRVR